nr:retrovirus-related Pol polyprotein from transposon TNT 1-94 [Tanacetum cinerariifolium]
DKDDIMLVQVYIDDIIFGSTKKSLCDEFEALMNKRFQISFIGELTFFLRLQVKQSEEGIFISQDKYVAEVLKKFDFSSVKTASTPIETQKPLVKDEVAADVDVHLYRFVIGSLMYLMASRPDIMFAVCACSRIFLAFASFMGFIVDQIDVKSAFLYDIIEEEVYVSQPLGFIDLQFPNKVYKVEKALYGLHQAPRAWYETLSTFLLQNRYRRGTIDKTLFIKKDKDDIMLVQVYVDDIIFGSNKKSLSDKFEALMHKRF